ncbi:MAG TPA: type II toxin-antitoxin system Phd/YefM family antitoxin [Thermoleophilia bacterium]|nr:type II toxin-antitoxin system Phd/YefM family antitoxin [Thermoleophilia bacterium]
MSDDFRCSSASVSELRAHLAEYLKLLELRRVRFVVERHGAPVATLVTVGDFETPWRRSEDLILAELLSESSDSRPRTYSEFLEARGLLDEGE